MVFHAEVLIGKIKMTFVAPMRTPGVSKYPNLPMIIVTDTEHSMMKWFFRMFLRPRHGHDSSLSRVLFLKPGIKCDADYERLVFGETIFQVVHIVVGDLGRGVDYMLFRFMVCFLRRFYRFLCWNVRPSDLRANAVRRKRSASIADKSAGIFGRFSFNKPLIIVQEKSRW